MNAPRYAENAAKVISTVRRGEGPAPTAESRTAAIVAIEQALRAKRAAARRRRTLGVVFAVAAAGVLAIGATKLHHAPAPVAMAPVAPATDITMVGHPSGVGATVEGADHRSTPLVDGAKLAHGSQVVAGAAGGVTLAFSTGTKLTMSEGAKLSLDGEGSQQIFGLSAGAVRAEVAKLVGAQRFVVRTADTEVEVRGTVFQVSHVAPVASCGGGTPTRVAVTEGVVVVRHEGVETRVRAGESWPAGCASAAPIGMAPAPAPTEAPSKVAERPHAPVSAPTPVVAAPRARANDPVPASELNEPSRLAEQNDLFQRGIASRRGGAAVEAVSQFDELLRRYPGGPLTESAMVERMRALRTIDARRAADAARDYAKRYPNGFAKGEAVSLIEAAR